MPENNVAYFESPIGIIELKANETALTGLNFVEEKIFSEKHTLILVNSIKQLNEYFIGKRTIFDLPLHPEGTDFQKKVWDQLLKIPFGATKSYLDIAHTMGNRKALRAVGNANGKNKISIIIPCHRVIGANGALTGFGSGIWRKRWLLDHEKKFIQASLF